MIENAINTVQISGVHSLTMRKLGDSVGIKSASVMYHFKSKNELVHELVCNYCDDFFTILNNTSVDPMKKLNKLVDIFQDVLKENKFCLCGMLAIEHNNISEETNLKLKDFFDKLNLWISSILKDLNIDTNLSGLILSSLEGGLLLDKMANSTKYLDSVKNFINDLKR